MNSRLGSGLGPERHLRVTHAIRHLGERKDDEAGVGHSANGVVQKGRLLNLRPRKGSGWRGVGSDGNRLPAGDVRVATQIVVEVLAVATEHSRELVDLALVEGQAGEAVGIAAEAAAISAGFGKANEGNTFTSSQRTIRTSTCGSRIGSDLSSCSDSRNSTFPSDP